MRRLLRFAIAGLVIGSLIACGDESNTTSSTTRPAPSEAHHEGSANGLTWSVDVTHTADEICVDLALSGPQQPTVIQPARRSRAVGTPLCSSAELSSDLTSVDFEPLFLAYVTAAGPADFLAAGVAAPEIDALRGRTTSGEALDIDVFDSGFFLVTSPENIEELEISVKDDGQLRCGLQIDDLGLWSLTDCEHAE